MYVFSLKYEIIVIFIALKADFPKTEFLKIKNNLNKIIPRLNNKKINILKMEISSTEIKIGNSTEMI